MADVQTSRGFTRIANKLLEATLLAGFTGTQLKIVLAIIRLTYGWNRTEVTISAANLAGRVGLSAEGGGFRSDLRALLREGVLVEVEPGRGQTPPTYAVQKNYEAWGAFGVNEGKLRRLFDDLGAVHMTDRSRRHRAAPFTLDSVAAGGHGANASQIGDRGPTGPISVASQGQSAWPLGATVSGAKCDTPPQLDPPKDRKDRKDKKISLGSSGDEPTGSDGVTVPDESVPEAPSAPAPFEPEFEACWAAYPSRGGHANPKRAAHAKWLARRRQGVLAAALLEGTRRYAAYCDATRKTGTEFVKQAATFYGPDEWYAQPWAPGASSANGNGATNGNGTHATPEVEREAVQLWAGIKRVGMLTASGREQFQEAVRELVTAGDVHDAESFTSLFRTLDRGLLQAARTDDYAVRHIAAAITSLHALT
jgi:phage replication O-like protein O